MDAKTAVKVAKEYILELFADEQITNVGLEEIKFDYCSKVWSITMGFSRPWNQKNSLTASIGTLPPRRAYKVIRLNDANGEVESLKDRILESPRPV